MNDDLLTYKEAAVEFGYTYQSIRAHICNKKIQKAYKGLVRRSEMQRYVNSFPSHMGRPKKALQLQEP